MIDHSRIATGFDLEILLGNGYFLTILQGAYDAGQIPDRIVTNNNGDYISIGKPRTVTILEDNAQNAQGIRADIEVVIPIKLIDWTEVTMGMGITIETNQVRIEYRYMDETTRGLIQIFGLLTNNPNFLTETENKIRTQLNQAIPLDLVASDVAEMQVHKVPAEGNFQIAYGLYLNLNLQIASQNQHPETTLIHRGDLSRARSFLPQNRTFVVGVGNETFGRMANDLWHSFGKVQSDGSIDHPVKDGDEKVGVYKSVSISPIDGCMKVTITSEIFIDWWPDADVTAVFHFTPYIKNHELSFDIKLTEFDADTGLLGDFLSFLLGGLLGALIGAFFGPVGLAIGASIGGVGGIATVEITEEVMEGQFSDQVEAEANEASVVSAFSAFPVRKRLFTDSRDPFFKRHYELVTQFEEVNVNSIGMSIEGFAKMEGVNEPVDTTIIDKTHSTASGNWFGFGSLTYQLPRLGNIVMPIGEVLRRIPLKQIQCVQLKPVAIHRKASVVEDIKFLSGLELSVKDTVQLQDAHILVVKGFKLIHPNNAHPYYRAVKDNSLDNNFESLPVFEPRELVPTP